MSTEVAARSVEGSDDHYIFKLECLHGKGQKYGSKGTQHMKKFPIMSPQIHRSI